MHSLVSPLGWTISNFRHDVEVNHGRKQIHTAPVAVAKFLLSIPSVRHTFIRPSYNTTV